MVYPQMKESEEHELLTQMSININSSPTQLDAYIKPVSQIRSYLFSGVT